MFRGGRVDSRGTGITSGLGYNAGGRVGYNKGNLVAPLYSAYRVQILKKNRCTNDRFTNITICSSIKI
jgi:hypothetical protein